MTCGLTHIGRGTAKIHDTRPQEIGNFILKREKGRDSSGGTENEPDVEMGEGVITKTIDLSADLMRMCPCVWKAGMIILLGSVWAGGLGSKVLSKNVRTMRSNM